MGFAGDIIQPLQSIKRIWQPCGKSATVAFVGAAARNGNRARQVFGRWRWRWREVFVERARLGCGATAGAKCNYAQHNNPFPHRECQNIASPHGIGGLGDAVGIDPHPRPFDQLGCKRA